MEELRNLVLQWENIARRKFEDAKTESDPMGVKLIEHGAMCYFNCSQELKRYLDELSPPASTSL